MKINCACGNIIHDLEDAPHKAHIIADQDWWTMLDGIDAAIENPGATLVEREAAVRQMRRFIRTRMAWQCIDCGRLYIDDQQNHTQIFLPETDQTTRHLFQSNSVETT